MDSHIASVSEWAHEAVQVRSSDQLQTLEKSKHFGAVLQPKSATYLIPGRFKKTSVRKTWGCSLALQNPLISGLVVLLQRDALTPTDIIYKTRF